ncbi:MAG TPA: YfhO family protein, partial [Vicinamibacterales bacterium]|nr:YfhO family protein [Vicinamibacterales bacterium]
ASAAVFRRSADRGRAVELAVLMIAVTIADLGLQASMYTSAEPMSMHYGANVALLDLLRHAPENARAYTIEATEATARPDPVRPSDNVFMHEHLLTAGGYDSFELATYRTARNLLDDDLRQGSSFLASVYGLRYLVSEAPLTAGGLRRVGATATAAIYENTGSLPRFYVAGSARRVSGPDEAFADLRAHDLQPGGEVLIESAGDLATSTPGTAGLASTVVFRPEEIQLSVHADRDAYLVANDTFYPGWSATVDGQPAPLLRANGNMRAVPVKAGDHRLTMRFSPTLLLAESRISAVAAAGLVLGVVVMLTAGERSRLRARLGERRPVPRVDV